MLFASLLLLLSSCQSDKKDGLFTYLSPSRSGIDFSNTIVESEEVNARDCVNCFNGGGVGIGDFDNDGMPDLVFTGNQVSSRLYLNRGALEFEDVSEPAGFVTSSWVTGVSIIDINADGLDDIYLSVGGLDCNEDCHNLLFVNRGLNEQGIPMFEELAKEYGLDDGRYAQQAVFFDYDQDGDLDVYIVHNKNRTNFNRNMAIPKNLWTEELTDFMLRNDRVEGIDHPVFTNVSEELGLIERGYGLGVGIADFNNDNRVDVYVSNDFVTDDLLYLNLGPDENGNSRFEEASTRYLSHMTINAMGMDIADMNNDQIDDVLVLDMLPNGFKRHKRVMNEMDYSLHLTMLGNGYTPQYMRNTLQLGNGMLGEQPVKSSEVGMFYEITSTDWSWAPLLLDFDNDGDKDLYVTNGFIKDVIDRDFIKFQSPTSAFKPSKEEVSRILNDLSSIYVPNFIYEMDSTGLFKDVSHSWIEERASLSSGIAFADLDLDGDLDLAVNNLNEKAFLIENRTDSRLENNFLRIELQGNPENRHGIGAKVHLWHNGVEHYQFQSLVRGYLSSMEPVVHFGLGPDTEGSDRIDSVKVVWPDGRVSIEKDIEPNQVLSVSQSTAVSFPVHKRSVSTLFNEVDSLLTYRHLQTADDEFRQQPLLYRQYSQDAPILASADIDGEPGEELFVGGNLLMPARILVQDENGIFQVTQVLDSARVDADAVFFDADGDGDHDLFIARGGNLFKPGSPEYADRLYANDGSGYFEPANEALPPGNRSTGCVVPIDFDKDGDLDLFIGARISPKNYPKIPKSVLLINKGGKFEELSPESFSHLGMVTAATAADLDDDGWEDLIITGEFSEMLILKNDQGTLKLMDCQWLDGQGAEVSTSGFWNAVRAADFDGDGDLDLIAGNRGLNAFLRPREGLPVYLYKGDFDQDGVHDPILGQYFRDEDKMTLFPVQTRDEVEEQFPNSRIQYLTYQQYAEIEFKTLLEIDELDSETLRADTFESSYFENQGEGVFLMHALPRNCQMAPINDILVGDYDNDGFVDALLVGNDHATESNYGRLDACTGIYLKGGPGGFEAVPSRKSGFYVPGQSNSVIRIEDRNGKTLILAGQNNEMIKVFE